MNAASTSPRSPASIMAVSAAVFVLCAVFACWFSYIAASAAVAHALADAASTTVRAFLLGAWVLAQAGVVGATIGLMQSVRVFDQARLARRHDRAAAETRAAGAPA